MSDNDQTIATNEVAHQMQQEADQQKADQQEADRELIGEIREARNHMILCLRIDMEQKEIGSLLKYLQMKGACWLRHEVGAIAESHTNGDHSISSLYGEGPLLLCHGGTAFRMAYHGFENERLQTKPRQFVIFHAFEKPVPVADVVQATQNLTQIEHHLRKYKPGRRDLKMESVVISADTRGLSLDGLPKL